MIEHICLYCNYNTKQKCDYDKHLLTTKHKNNLFIKKNKIRHNLEDNSCEYCNFNSKQRRDYNKHLLTKKHIQNVKNVSKVNNKNIDNSGNIIIEKIDELSKQNNELKKKIEHLEKVNNENTNKIVKEARVIKRSLLSMLNNEYKNTPSIDYIKEDVFKIELEEEFKYKIDDKENRLFMRIFSDYEKKKLIGSICNVIIRIIKKEDQKQQSVFNIDAARGNYATKIQDIWHNDKKGLQLKKYTIDVVTKYMINIMDIYRERLIDMYNENKVKKNIKVTDYIMEKQGLLLNINAFLTNPITHKKIILQLCPELRFDDNIAIEN